MNNRRYAAALLLTVGFAAEAAYSAPPASADGGQDARETTPAVLRIRVLEGEGSVHTVGTRSSRPIAVQLTDEAGRPVEGASVSVRLPDSGPTGVFADGMRTDILQTGPDGRVTIRVIQWAGIPGPLQIRITASKGEARAGILSTQYLTEPVRASAQRRAPDPAKGDPPSSTRIEKTSKSKWILLTALIGGAAVGGIAAATGGNSSTSARPGAPPAVTQPTVSIGPPAVTIGRP